MQGHSYDRWHRKLQRGRHTRLNMDCGQLATWGRRQGRACVLRARESFSSCHFSANQGTALRAGTGPLKRVAEDRMGRRQGGNAGPAAPKLGFAAGFSTVLFESEVVAIATPHYQLCL